MVAQGYQRFFFFLEYCVRLYPTKMYLVRRFVEVEPFIRGVGWGLRRRNMLFGTVSGQEMRKKFINLIHVGLVAFVGDRRMVGSR